MEGVTELSLPASIRLASELEGATGNRHRHNVLVVLCDIASHEEFVEGVDCNTQPGVEDNVGHNVLYVRD